MVSNGSGGFVGFKPEDMLVEYDQCGNYLCNILSELCNTSQALLDNVSTIWASPEAVDYLGNVATDLNLFLNRTCNTFTNIMTTIKSAGDSWSNTSKEVLSLSNFDNKISNSIKTINSNAQASINGLVGVDVTEFKYGSGNNEINNLLSTFKSHAEKLGFVGGNQLESLLLSLSSVLTTFEDKRIKFYSEVNQKIKDIASKYQDTAGQIKASFDAIG